MDWSAAIERNREALKRVLAMLVAMVGVTAGPHPEARADPELVEGEPRSPHPEVRAEGEPRSPHPEVRAEGEPRRTLPRHLHRAVLRLLRPAEAAARRLVIASASGLVVPPPRLRKPRPKPMATEPLLRRFGIAVVMPTAAHAAAARRAAGRGAAARPRVLRLPLLDPLRPLSHGRRRYVPAHAAPRIRFPGSTVGPHPEVRAGGEPRRTPDDPIDAARLGLRLAALAAALDDLPGQAKRFARWKAARDAAGAQNKNIRVADARKTPGRIRRISPLRTGRPPGGRLSRYNPTATHPRGIREVDEILAHSHALAMYALQRRDTS
jgi:hypothetical protein